MFAAGRSPNVRLLLVALVGLAAAAAVLMQVLSSPWYGLDLKASGAADAVIAHIGRPGEPLVAVLHEDLTEEPDGLPDYPAMQRFFDRQTILDEVVAGAPVTVRADGRPDTILAAGRRGVAELPATFWVQVLTGVGGLIIGGWIWAIRPGDLPARLFAISGLGLMISALAAATYSTRELAMDGRLFRVLSDINHLGVHMFAAAMIGLFLTYPRRLLSPRWLWLAPGVLGAVYLSSLARLAPGPAVDLYLPVVVATGVILALIGVQWRGTRLDPQGRAALTWLGLSVTIGCGAFVALAAGPILLQTPRPPQGYAFGAFLAIYGGLALGLRRFRLFEAGEWAYRVLFFTLGAVLLLLLDAALILTLHWSEAAALGGALMLVGFLYLPLRDLIWRRLSARRRMQEHELFGVALDVAFASPAEKAERWRGLMQKIFDPLEIGVADGPPPSSPVVREDGLIMVLPAVAGAPALRLAYAGGGRSLFTPAQLKLATQLVALTRQAETSRAAHERGAAEERSRMAKDLHDDVGARLLSGLHTADEKTRPLLHAALAEIRFVVSGLTGDRAALDRVLADARHEAGRRLEVAGIALDWRAAPLQRPDLPLDYRRHKALASAFREAVSNVIRHSRASVLSVTLAEEADRLVLSIRDNGVGLPPAALAGGGSGHGMRNLRQRMEDIGGQLHLSNGIKGAMVRLVIPLGPALQPASAPDPAMAQA